MEMKIPPELDGVALDKFVKKECRDIPFTALFRLLRKKRVRVNGRPVSDPKTVLAAGDELVIEELAPSTQPAGPRGPALSILFEDEHLIVVDKPSGLAVHPGAGEGGRTVIAALRSRAAGYEPHLAHRLDKYTSGVLVTAKDRKTSGKLGALFKERDPETRKTYLAVVCGRAPRQEIIDQPLDGRDAVTRFRLIRAIPWRNKGLSLVEARIDTGRMHQIRRHLAASGLPLAGDDEYGNWEINELFQADFKIKHFLLHSYETRLRHPVSEMLMSFTAPVPEAFRLIFGDAVTAALKPQRKKR
jgi:23S rRNA pseudouridine955/2504/2580 synthase